MREIEFRGKAIHPNSLEQIVGSWAYGGIFENKIITRNLDMDSHYHGFISEIEIDIKTIGQYTGLKDKNGKKIFEGDIVNCKFFDRMVGDIAGVINFTDCVWAVSDFKNKRLYQSIDVDNIEIIGNIHENPELLEGTE
ncbi:YopX family protein [Listeria innocua]